MPSIAEMLIEADRTAKSDADLRVKVALILEHARAEVQAERAERDYAVCDECGWRGKMSHVRTGLEGAMCPVSVCESTDIRQNLREHEA
jgi:hypothetical protein